MKHDRLFQIIYALLEKQTVTAPELAEKLEVSVRTIYRDTETLSAAGVPIYMSKGKGGGISLLPGFVLNKTMLTHEEKQEIISSLQAVSAVNLGEANSALAKLGFLFGKSETDWLEVDFSLWYNDGRESEIFNTLKSAVISKHIAEFDYSGANGEQSTRRVQPLRLCFKGMSRYLYGYCTLREDYRFFKLSRIKNLQITEDTFERVLQEPVLKDAQITDGEYVDLTLKIGEKMSYRVYDEFENYEKQPDGSFIANIRYPKTGGWLFSYIASFGTECEVLAPEDVRESVKKDLQKMLQKY